jgi:hypothetical protein
MLVRTNFVFKTTLQILDAVIVGRILLYFIAHALELFCVFAEHDIAELYWFCMDFYGCRYCNFL